MTPRRILRYIYKKIYLSLNTLRLSFTIRRKGNFFEIAIHEKYKTVIKIIRYILTIISLVSAFFYFRSVWYALLFALVVFLVLEILNRILFIYTSMYIHPLPQFLPDSQKWSGCFFGYATHPTMPGQVPVVGWQLADEAYVMKIHELLLEWSFGKLNDEENNICTSVILMEDNSYVFFCYPNIERKTANSFFKDIEKQHGKKSKNDIHYRIHMLLIIGKRFPISDKSYLPTFIKRYRSDVPFIFRLAISGHESDPEPIENIDDFMLRNLKIKKRTELTRKDNEYDFVRVLDR